MIMHYAMLQISINQNYHYPVIKNRWLLNASLFHVKKKNHHPVIYLLNRLDDNAMLLFSRVADYLKTHYVLAAIVRNTNYFIQFNQIFNFALLFSTGLDTKSEPCQRFFREGLTVSFTKIMTDEAVSGWKYEIHVSFSLWHGLSHLRFSHNANWC